MNVTYEREPSGAGKPIARYGAALPIVRYNDGVPTEERFAIVALIRRLLRKRIVRYALVGGIGIPINVLAFALFLRLMGSRFDLVASACSFEVSTTVNFVLNQLFTYSEQKHLRGWDWPKRALRAQMASLSALLLAFAIRQLLHYGLHVDPYLSQVGGIAGSFFYNFAVSNRFVFRPAPSPASKSAAK